MNIQETKKKGEKGEKGMKTRQLMLKKKREVK